MGAARRRPTRRRLKLKRRIPPRAARYARSVHPPDGATLQYRLLVRRLVARWWAKIGPQALGKAKKIAKPTPRTDAEGSDEADEADASLADYSSEADAGWLTSKINGVAESVDRHSQSEFKRLGIKLRKADPGVAKLVPGFRKENVGLVKTMLRSEQSKLEALLRDGSGRRYESLAADIEDRFGITTRHAELIARDQCNKLNSNISHTRMRNAGITKAIWTTAGDERVRESHDALDGQPFDLDAPPTPDDEDEPALPGEPINCRCVSFPILDELDDPDEAEDDEQ